MKFAVIFQEGHRSPEFRRSKGHYTRLCATLESQGYKIIEINVTSLALIPSTLSEIPDKSLGFLIIRGHGEPKKIDLTSGIEISSDNIKSVFSLLPSKLMEKGTIFLDSCLTGDFYNNIQFSFAKLTVALPEVQIIAAISKMYMYSFEFSHENGFSFQMWGTDKAGVDISRTLGAVTKKILAENAKELDNLSSIAKQLRASLLCNGIDNGHPDSTFKYVSTNIIGDSGHEVTRILINFPTWLYSPISNIAAKSPLACYTNNNLPNKIYHTTFPF